LDLNFVCKNTIPCGYDLALAHTLYCKRFVRLRVHLKFTSNPMNTEWSPIIQQASSNWRFLRWGDVGREVLWLYEYSQRSQGEISGIQVQGRSFCLVGEITDFLSPTREGTCNFMVAPQSTIFITVLWAATIPAIPRVSTRRSNHPGVC
jgi:hypothetical protein